MIMFDDDDGPEGESGAAHIDSLPYELDDEDRIGSVFFVRSGVLNQTEETSLVHHWALAVHFEDGEGCWVLLEGLRKNGLLTSTYSKKHELDLDTHKVYKLKEFVPQLKGLSMKQHLVGVLTLMTLVKALSGTTMQTVKTSPLKLHTIAAEILNAPYVLGTNDCHTWFLRALSKLENYQVGEKTLGEMAANTFTNAVAMESKPIIEVASGGTSAVREVVGTGKQLFSKDRDENVAKVVTTGSANTVNHLIKGVTNGVGAGVDAAAGAAANLAGLASLGGCASKNPNAVLDKAPPANSLHANVQRVGKAGGDLAYGVGGLATSAVGTVGNVSTAVVSGAANVVGSSATHIGKGFASGVRRLGLLRRK